MSFNPRQFREYIIRPTLKYIEAYSENAEELLMLTAAQESHLGQFLHQVNGPARGVYQIEPATEEDIWNNFLRYREGLESKVDNLRILNYTVVAEMEGNLYYATAMARCMYLRHSELLPDKKDLRGMAEYYKKYFNTIKGAAKIEDVFDNYHRYC